MAKYVPDVKTQRWVVIAPHRTQRPDEKAEHKTACPFCPGNEAMTPPEVYRIGAGDKDTQGWQVRVVPNKYAITDTHEVIIHSPDHERDIEDLPLESVTRIFTAYRDRYRTHDDDGQVLIFCNHGLHSGASLMHPHSQLVVVPRQINLDTLSREPIANVIEESTNFISYCPDFSQWPYEVWLVPKDKGNRFGDVNERDLPDLAGSIQRAVQRIKKIFLDPELSQIHPTPPFVYNFYVYHGVDWYIRIIPRFIHRAGFELGTGLNVNVIDPAEAACELNSVRI